MSRPKPKSDYVYIRQLRRPIGWVVVVLFGILADVLIGAQGKVAAAITSGASLNYVMYLFFAYISYRKVSAATQIFGQMALALLIKWLIAVLGFGLIFAYLPKLPAAAVLMGFVLMQVAVAVNLWKIGKRM